MRILLLSLGGDLDLGGVHELVLLLGSDISPEILLPGNNSLSADDAADDLDDILGDDAALFSFSLSTLGDVSGFNLSISFSEDDEVDLANSFLVAEDDNRTALLVHNSRIAWSAGLPLVAVRKEGCRPYHLPGSS